MLNKQTSSERAEIVIIGSAVSRKGDGPTEFVEEESENICDDSDPLTVKEEYSSSK